MLQIRSIDPGFRSDNVVTLRTVLPMPKYSKTMTRVAFYERVLGEIRQTPGLAGAAYISFLPMDLTAGIWPVNFEGQPEDPSRAHSAILNFVTPGFFDQLKIPLREGRDVKESDVGDTPFVAVVSESFAKDYWPNQDPIGRHFKFALNEREIVGVVGDVRFRGLGQTGEAQVYLPYKQVSDGDLVWYAPKDLVVRTKSQTSMILPELRRIIHGADSELPISNVQRLSDIVDGQTLSRRVQLSILGAFASVSLLLAGVGIYGLLASSVSQRTQEIGVRMALGARTSNILKVVLGEGFRLTLTGIAVGVTIAYGGAKIMESLLAGIHPDDLPTFLIAVVLSLLTATLGALLPALRAINVDPVTAMRTE
jgi:putative ABC transport system permease protein